MRLLLCSPPRYFPQAHIPTSFNVFLSGHQGGLSECTHQSADVVLEDGEPIEEDGATFPSVVHGAPTPPVRLSVVRVGLAHGVAADANEMERTQRQADVSRRVPVIPLSSNHGDSITAILFLAPHFVKTPLRLKVMSPKLAMAPPFPPLGLKLSLKVPFFMNCSSSSPRDSQRGGYGSTVSNTTHTAGRRFVGAQASSSSAQAS